MQLRYRSIVLFAAALFAGCGGSSNPDNNDAGVVNCQSDPRVLNYVANVSVTSASGSTKYALVSDPAPPAHGNDTWNLHVTNVSSGQPVAGLNLGIKTLMPDHGHGSPTTPNITDKGGGDYQVTPLYLFMPGVWQITFMPTATPSDTAVFMFCVQG